MTAGLSSYTGSLPFFDICRAVQGVACALMIPSSLAILGGTYPSGKKKNLVFALFAACAPNGFLLGAVISASLAQEVVWMWAYYLPAMLTFLLVIAAAFIIPHSDKQKYQTFDLWGAFTGVTSLILINFAFNQGPIAGWSTPYVYCLLIAGIVLFILFVFVEGNVAEHPLIPPSVLTFDAVIILFCVAMGWATFGIWLWFLVQFLHILRHVTPLMTVAMLVPVGITGTAASLLAGVLVRKIHASYLMVISLAAFCAGTIIVATMPVDQIYWAQTFVSIFIMPFGMDMNFTAAMIILSDSIPKEHQGMAASLVNTVLNYAVSIGLGVAGTVAIEVSATTTELFFFRCGWYTGIGFSGLGFLVACVWIVVRTLNKKSKEDTAVKDLYYKFSQVKVLVKNAVNSNNN